MSELSRTILGGTELISRAQEGLAQVKAKKQERRYQSTLRLREAGDALDAEMEHFQNLREAKAEEDDVKSILDADALGQASGDEQARIKALEPMRPKTLKGAMILAKARDKAKKAVIEATDRKYDQATKYLTWKEANDAAAEVSPSIAVSALARKGLHVDPSEVKGWTTAKLNEVLRYLPDVEEVKPPKPEDPRDVPLNPALVAQLFKQRGITGISPMGVTQKMLADLNITAVTPKEPEGDKDPTGSNTPLTDEEASTLEGAYKLPSGTLRGKTRWFAQQLRADPEQQILQLLRIQAAQRAAADDLPMSKEKWLETNMSVTEKAKLDELKGRIGVKFSGMPLGTKPEDLKELENFEAEMNKKYPMPERLVVAPVDNSTPVKPGMSWQEYNK